MHAAGRQHEQRLGGTPAPPQRGGDQADAGRRHDANRGDDPWLGAIDQCQDQRGEEPQHQAEREQPGDRRVPAVLESLVHIRLGGIHGFALSCWRTTAPIAC